MMHLVPVSVCATPEDAACSDRKIQLCASDFKRSAFTPNHVEDVPAFVKSVIKEFKVIRAVARE
jgi:hypothetical protein